MWTALLNKYLIGAVLAAGIAGYLYHLGYARADAQCDVTIYREQIASLQVQLQRARDEATAAQIESKALKAKADKVHETVKTIIQKVPSYVKDDRACDFPPDFVRALNQARRDSDLQPAAGASDAGG